MCNWTVQYGECWRAHPWESSIASGVNVLLLWHSGDVIAALLHVLYNQLTGWSRGSISPPSRVKASKSFLVRGNQGSAGETASTATDYNTCKLMQSIKHTLKVHNPMHWGLMTPHSSSINVPSCSLCTVNSFCCSCDTFCTKASYSVWDITCSCLDLCPPVSTCSCMGCDGCQLYVNH